MFMAHFVEIELNTENGEVKIVDLVAVHDSGRIINPAICETQVMGGALLGGGFGISEDLLMDEQTGRVLNPNYFDYTIFTALETPPIDVSFVDVIDPVGAFGVKSIGEGSCCPTAAAIGQAIYNAIGIRLSVPFTPEKILQALQSNGKQGKE